MIHESPLVLTDVVTDAGAIGHSIMFTYSAVALGPAPVVTWNLLAIIVQAHG